MNLVALSFSYIRNGKIKQAKPKGIYFDPSFWDMDWDTDLAVFDLSNFTSKREYASFLQTAREEEIFAAKNNTRQMLASLPKLRGEARKEMLDRLEGRLVFVHEQKLILAKRRRTVLSYLKPSKKDSARMKEYEARAEKEQASR